MAWLVDILEMDRVQTICYSSSYLFNESLAYPVHILLDYKLIVHN